MSKYKSGSFPSGKRQPSINTNPFYTKSHVNPLEINEGSKNQLIVAVQSGDYDKIKRVIADRNISYNVRDELGQNPIHLIIKNDIIGDNERKKLELVKFFISNGVSISQFDNNNVTPLHLACKFQYADIVETLLKNGADPNAKDSQGMIPLHYATQGFIKPCKIKKKVKSIIPKPKQGDRVIPDVKIKELSISIIDILQTPHFNIYLTHISNTLKRIKDIYPEDFEKIRDEMNQEINKIIIDTTTSDAKKAELLQNYYDSTVNGLTEKFINKKFNKSLTSIDTKLKREGWSPIDNSEYKILSKNPSDIVREIDVKKKNELKGLYPQNEIDKFIKMKLSLTDFKEDCYKNLIEIILLLRASDKNSILYGIPGFSDIDIENYVVHKDVNKFTGDFKTIYGDIPLEMFDGKSDYDQYYDNLKVFRAPSKIVKEWKQSKNRKLRDGLKQYKVIDENLMVGQIGIQLPCGDDIYTLTPFANNIDSISTLGDLDASKIDTTVYPTGTVSFPKGGTCFFLTPLIGCVLQCEKRMQVIASNYDIFIKHLDKGYNFELYNLILVTNYINCLDTLQYIRYAFDEKEYIEAVINNFYGNINEVFKRNREKSCSYLLEEASIRLMDQENVKDIMGINNRPLNTLITTIYEMLDKLYSIVINIIKNLNKHIDSLNEFSGAQFIKNFNGSGFGKDEFKALKISPIDNFIDKPFKKFKLPPQTRLDYVNREFVDFENSRNKLINEYIPKIDDRHNPTYYKNFDGKFPDIDEVFYIDTQGAKFNLSDLKRRVGTVGEPKKGYLLNFKVQPDYDWDKLELGKKGIELTEYQQIKKNPAPSSINGMLDDHLEFIKLVIVYYLILAIHNIDDEDYLEFIDTPDGKTASEKKEKIKDALDRLNVPDALEGNRSLYFYSMISGIADELVTEHIKYYLKNSLSTTIRTFFEDRRIGDNKPELRIKDIGFSLNLKDIFERIIYKFKDGLEDKKSDFLNLRNTLSLILEDQEEIEEISEQFPIYNFDYTQMNLIEDDQCFKIEPKIIKLLREYRSNMNPRDNVHATPLVYALNTLHIELIDECLNNGCAVATEKSKNIVGITPYTHLFELIKQNSGDVKTVKELIDRFTKPFYDNLRRMLLDKKEFKNNVVKYLDILFPMIIIMYNGLLFRSVNRYTGNWSKEKYDKLIPTLQKLNKPQKSERYTKDFVGILEKGTDTMKYGSDNDVLAIKEKRLIEEIDTLKKNMIQQERRISDLRDDMNAMTDKSEIEELINDERAELAKNNALLGNLERERIEIGKNLSNNTWADYSIWEGRRDGFVSFNVRLPISEFYDNIFNQVINAGDDKGYMNYMAYNRAWYEYITVNYKDVLNNIGNIHLVSSIAFNTMIDNNSQNDLDIGNIHNIYQDVFKKIALDLNELPKEIKENYVLGELMGIFVHVMKHIVCVNLYHAVVKTITKWFISSGIEVPTEEGDDYFGIHRKVEGVTQEVINRVQSVVKQNDTFALRNYIVDTMPKKIVKTLLGIYNDDYDEDRDIRGIDELIAGIKPILLRSPELKDNISLFNNLDNYIYPYYKAIIEEVTPQMMVLIDNYNRFIINEERLINISGKVLEQAKKEVMK